MTKVSVIIPVYNTEKYLRKCLDSVVNQTLKDLEIICIDDGSTDSSLQILKEYARKDSRIVIIKQRNKHAGVARNNGLKIAKGEFIHFLDSDDWLELNAYEKLYDIIKNTGADLVKFKAYSYNNKTGEITSRPYLDIEWVNKKYFDNYLSIDEAPQDTLRLPDSPWSGIYKREFLQNNKIYFDNLICANDGGFFYRCIINAKKVYLSSEKLYYYRENMETSLVAKRVEHFDCQITLHSIIKQMAQKLPENLYVLITNRIFDSVIHWYNRCLNEKHVTKIIKRKIDNQMYKFLKQTSVDKFSKTTKEKAKEIIYQIEADRQLKTNRRKNICRKIFSVQNIGWHKVICITGIKFKFKSHRLMQRERINNLEQQINDLKKELNTIQERINI